MSNLVWKLAGIIHSALDSHLFQNYRYPKTKPTCPPTTSVESKQASLLNIQIDCGRLIINISRHLFYAEIHLTEKRVQCRPASVVQSSRAAKRINIYRSARPGLMELSVSFLLVDRRCHNTINLSHFLSIFPTKLDDKVVVKSRN